MKITTRRSPANSNTEESAVEDALISENWMTDNYSGPDEVDWSDFDYNGPDYVAPMVLDRDWDDDYDWGLCEAAEAIEIDEPQFDDPVLERHCSDRAIMAAMDAAKAEVDLYAESLARDAWRASRNPRPRVDPVDTPRYTDDRLLGYRRNSRGRPAFSED